jgi:hypothetical protein
MSGRCSSPRGATYRPGLTWKPSRQLGLGGPDPTAYVRVPQSTARTIRASGRCRPVGGGDEFAVDPHPAGGEVLLGSLDAQAGGEHPGAGCGATGGQSTR